MDLNSPYWITGLGVCQKHHLPQIPCPQCLAERDPDVEVRMTPADFNILEAAAVLGEKLTVRDLLPQPHADWLYKRLIN